MKNKKYTFVCTYVRTFDNPEISRHDYQFTTEIYIADSPEKAIMHHWSKDIRKEYIGPNNFQKILEWMFYRLFCKANAYCIETGILFDDWGSRKLRKEQL